MLCGKELEEAVAPVVAAILVGDKIGTREFKIEPNKTVSPLGVPHEIDVYVTEQTSAGERIYLFECKNWKRRVGKEAVVSLKAKMNLVGAKRGFIVALRFGKHARTQAKIDGVELLDAKKHEISPVGLSAFNWFVKSIAIREVLAASGAIAATMHSTAKFGSEEMSLKEVLTLFAVDSARKRILQPDVQALPPGTHEVVCFSDITLPSSTAHGRTTNGSTPVAVLLRGKRKNDRC